ncbi:hypothetical protein VTK56DRAFT_6314 [Thermocarpiscus australiensis]
MALRLNLLGPSSQRPSGIGSLQMKTTLALRKGPKRSRHVSQLSAVSDTPEEGRASQSPVRFIVRCSP